MSDAIPGSIVAAICQIQQTVDSVHKSQRNAHGGYNYSSTDDIYAALTRKMGHVGLTCIALEHECEIVRVEKDGKTSQWVRLVFGFVLATKDASWTHPNARRSLYIQVTGPQTFQAAQSYAEKAFLRGLFKLPTGDLDLDSMPQAETEEDQVALARNGKAPRKSSAEGKRDGSVKLFNEIRGKIQQSPNADILQQVRQLYADEWAAMPRAWAETLDDDYETRMVSFGLPQAAE